MARVTVEDCILQVPNRFELVLLAAQRGRQVSAGAPLTVERDNDKNPVVALREIADCTVDLDNLRLGVVNGLQKRVEVDEPEEDDMATRLTVADEWVGTAQGEKKEVIDENDFEDHEGSDGLA